MDCILCQHAIKYGPSDGIFKDKGNRERLIARWSQLSPAKRLRYIAPLIVRAVGSAEDKTLLSSLPEPVVADVIEMTRRMLESSKGCRACTDPPECRTYYLRRLLVALSRSWKIIPSSMYLHGITLEDAHPINGGGYADIFRGSFQCQRVALKRPRTFSEVRKTEKEENAFRREVLVSWFLSHLNVQPFLGIDQDTFRSPPMICIVTPWQRNGNILDCLCRLKSLGLPILVDPWIKQIVEGLNYLHDHQIIHGDLRAGNILVDDHYVPKLTDFGLSILYGATSATLGSHTGPAGSTRFISPELLMDEKARPSFSSDVYAFGCVCIELFTLKAPFADVTNDAKVIAMITQGIRPCRPLGSDDVLNSFWDTIEQCWSSEPRKRPSSRTLAMSLPLRVSSFGTYNSLSHPHAEWPLSVSQAPPNSGANVLDSCLLHLLDVNTFTSVYNLFTCLHSIGCPLDIVQFVGKVLGNGDNLIMGGSEEGFQKASQDDRRSPHRSTNSTVDTRRSARDLYNAVPAYARRKERQAEFHNPFWSGSNESGNRIDSRSNDANEFLRGLPLPQRTTVLSRNVDSSSISPVSPEWAPFIPGFLEAPSSFTLPQEYAWHWPIQEPQVGRDHNSNYPPFSYVPDWN